MINEYITKVKGEFDKMFAPNLFNEKEQEKAMSAYISVSSYDSMIKSFLESSLREFASEVKGKVEWMKFKGDFAHDGEIYSPNQINEILDELVEQLKIR